MNNYCNNSKFGVYSIETLEVIMYEGWLKCQPSLNKMKVNLGKVIFLLVYFQKTSSILKVRV